MKIYCTRHGETDYNKAGIWQGQLDISLNETGIQQAKQLRKEFLYISFDAIYSSPLDRAKKTADIIANGQPVILKDELKEIALGSWEGARIEDIRRDFPEDLKLFDTTTNFCKHGVEPYEKLQERAWRAFQEIALSHEKEDTVLIVTHGAWLVSLLCKVNGISLTDRNEHIYVGNTEVLTFQGKKEKDKVNIIQLV